jgi:hypothetical protein
MLLAVYSSKTPHKITNSEGPTSLESLIYYVVGGFDWCSFSHPIPHPGTEISGKLNGMIPAVFRMNHIASAEQNS